MNYKILVALIFSIIVATELYFFLDYEPKLSTLTVNEKVSSVDPNERGFAKYNNSTKNVTTETTVVDAAAQNQRNKEYFVLIGATLAIGAISVYASPNKKN